MSQKAITTATQNEEMALINAYRNQGLSLAEAIEKVIQAYNQVEAKAL